MATKSPTKPKSKSQKAASKSALTSKASKSKPKSEWNILFYLAGDGLISASMISQLKAITDAGFEENTNVLVYFDPNCNGRNAKIFDVNAERKRLYTNPDTGKKTIIGDGRNPFVRDIADDRHIPCLPQIPAEITLRYFLEYARAYYPAKNHMLFLMGHGVIVGNDAFLPDSDDNSAITLADLGWILRTFADKVRADGEEFQLVGFHSCSMSSAELLYELEGSARYMIGTQGASFPGSWPYRQLLKKIFIAIDEARDAGNDAPELVGTILDGLQNLSFYNSEDFWLAGLSSDISLCSLNPDHVNGLRESIEILSQALQEGLDDPVALDCIRLAHLESQSYWQENYTDLFDFCSCLSERCEGGNDIQTSIKEACESVTWAINGKVPSTNGKTATKKGKMPTEAFVSFPRSADRSDQLVVFSDYYGPAYQFSNGLSIFFPWRSPTDKVIQNYRGYKFTREHGSKSWWSFLRQYFKVTQRKARSIRTPLRSSPEVGMSITFRSESNLLRTLSDERLLSLGPPPPNKEGEPTGKVDERSEKESGDLWMVGGHLSKVGGDLSKVAVELSKVGGDLSKVGGDLSDEGGDVAKIGDDMADKVGGDLSKVEVDLMKIMGDLSKVGGDLSKVGGDLSAGKVGGDLSKVGGDLSKVGGDLSKVGGDLSSKVGGDLSKVGGDLSKVGGDLSKVGGDLSKVGGDLGGFYGHTVIKNFASPEDQFITSRPLKFDNDQAKGVRPGNRLNKAASARK